MLAALGNAIDELSDAELDGLSDGELHELVTGLHRVDARLTAVRARATALWNTRQCWADDRSKSATARLAKDCKLAPAAAKREVRRARRLQTMPVTLAALADGTVSVDHVDELVAANQPGVAHLFLRDEALLVDQARTEAYATFHRTVGYWKQRADEEGAEKRAQRQHTERYFQAAVTFQNTVDLRGLLDPVTGAIVRRELIRLERQLFDADWATARAQHGPDALPEHLPRTAAQRWADALVEMARRSAAMDPDATFTRPLVTVLVGWETVHGRICQLSDGTVITPNQALEVLTEADIERVVFDPPPRVMEVGGRTRFFTGALRRAIEVRDRHCQHPGCTVPAEYCHIDHIIEIWEGGETTQDNGEAQCPVHNRTKSAHKRKRKPKRRPPRGP